RIDCGAKQVDIRRELGDECERKKPSHAIDARHHEADHWSRATGACRTDEAPGRAGQVEVEPALAKRGAALGEALAAPAGPGVDERLRHAPPQEVAVTRQLAEQPDLQSGLTSELPPIT